MKLVYLKKILFTYYYLYIYTNIYIYIYIYIYINTHTIIIYTNMLIVPSYFCVDDLQTIQHMAVKDT